MSFLEKTRPRRRCLPRLRGDDVGSAADVEAVMKKYDRESNTRYWEGIPKLVIQILMRLLRHTASSIPCFLPFCRSAVCPFSWA